MSSGPVASASVQITLDLTGIQAQLQQAINNAVAKVKVPPITVPVTSVGGAGGAGGGAAATAAAAAASNAGVASTKAARGVGLLAGESNALRGALIGLSHVTPVTVFGLGLYGTAALAAGLALKSAISSTADFEHQLNVLQATTDATDEEMKQIHDTAKALGADLSLPSTSAGDAARAMTELAKAGLSVKDTLAGVRGVLQLAAAAQLDVGSAATFVANELNAFGLAGSEATHVADLLAGASIAAQGEIRDFGTAFQQVSAVAHQANVSIETTTGALTELARAGLRGADAGTSFRTFLLRLTPTTKQAAQYQQALGIQLDKNRTIGQQLPQLIEQYRKALYGLTPVLQQQALTQIFGQDAYRAAAIFIRGGSAALDENTAAANRAGAANKLAQANAEGLSGAMNGLKSNLDTLGISLGELVKGPLTSFVTSLANATQDFTGLVDAVVAGAEKLSAIKIPPIHIPIVGDINIPGFDGKDKTGGSDWFKGFVTDLFALTPQGSSIVLPPRAVRRIKDIITNARKQVRDEIKKQQGIRQAQEQGSFGLDFFAPSKPIGGRQFSTEALGLNPILTAADVAAKAVREAKLKALNAIKQEGKKPIVPPLKLQIAQLQAQIDDNLNEELKVDRAIEKYFQDRLKLAKKGTQHYADLLKALAVAHAQTQSVLNEIGSAKDALTIPIVLQQSQLQAQINANLQQEEAADKQIEDYLEGRLARAKKGTKRYIAILQALKQARSDTLSVQKQIQSNATQALQTRLSNQETRLEIAAQTEADRVANGIQGTLFVLPGKIEGLLQKGNLDILHRKIAHLKNGVTASVRTITVGFDGVFKLLPTVIDGIVVSNKKAIEHFRKTGENLGTFKTEEAANKYAAALHRQQDALGRIASHPAEKALINFYKQQSENTKLTEAERLDYLKKLNAEQDNFRKAITAAAAAQIDVQDALQNLAIQRAQTLTPNDPADDKRKINLRIKTLKDRIKAFGTFKDLTAEEKKQVIAWQSEIVSLQGTLNNLKGLNQGPSLEDLFREAVKQFNDFGSNVTSQIQTGGTVRVAFAGSVAVQNPNLTNAEQIQISQGATTNSLLSQMLQTIRYGNDQAAKKEVSTTSKATPVGSRRAAQLSDFSGPAGFATALQQRSLAGLGGS